MQDQNTGGEADRLIFFFYSDHMCGLNERMKSLRVNQMKMMTESFGMGGVKSV